MTTQERLWEAQAAQVIPTDTATCPHCGGQGVISLDLNPGDADFGKSFKCLCRHLQDEDASRERQRLALEARLIEQNERCGIPDEYRGYSLEGYIAYCQRLGKLRKVDMLDGKGAALDYCRTMIEQDYFPVKSLHGDYQVFRYGVYLYGAFGIGKTSLMASILNARMEQGQSVHMLNFRQWLGRVQDTYKRRNAITRRDLIGYAVGVDMLGIDDAGDKDRIAPITDDQRDIMFELIYERHIAKRPIVWNSNLDRIEFANQFGGRIGQRVFELCHFVKVDGREIRE